MKLRKMLSVLTAAALVFSNLTIPVSAQEMETVVSSEGTVESESESMSKLEEDHYSEETAEIGANDETENSRSEEQSESNSDNESEVITEIKSSSQETGSESEAVTEIKSELQETETNHGSMTENEETVTQTESASQEESESQSEENTEVPTESIIETETFLTSIEEETTELTEEMIQAEYVEETLTEGDFKYEVGSNDEVTITDYTGSETSIVVPEEIDGKKVTSIGYMAFDGCSSLTSITLPEGLTKIDAFAFRSCSSLTEITLPEELTSIGSDAFSNCSSLSEIILPEGLTKIDAFAFEKCSNLEKVILSERLTSLGNWVFNECSQLKHISIPMKITKIAYGVFANCSSLESIHIPKNVEIIDSYAFMGCEKLAVIYYEGSEEDWKKIKINSDNAPVAMAEKVYTYIHTFENFTYQYAETDRSIIITGYVGSDPSIVIPDEIEGVKVSKIGYEAFLDCDIITDVTISEGIKEIGVSAFEQCKNLKNIVIPQSITYISDNAFMGCVVLDSITLPEGLTRIGDSSFANTGLTQITFPETLKIIGNSTFENCKSLKKLTFPKGLTQIGNSVFANTGLTQVIFPELITNIGDSTFKFCKDINKITLPEGLTQIGNSVFANTGLTQITFPETLKIIGDNTFQYCTNLNRVTLPEGLTQIGNSAFANTTLTEITIPEGVHIGDSVLANCTKLAKVIISRGVNIGKSTFSGCTELTNIIMPEDLDCIGENAFRGCRKLSGIFLPEGVTDIGMEAFRSCSNLDRIVLPKSLKNIDSMSFYMCDNLSKVYYNGSKEDWNKISIGSYNDQLYHATIFFPESLENNFLFHEVNGEITIVGVIEDQENVIVPSVINGKPVVRIGEKAFNECVNLQRILIPKSITSIENSAFYNCNRIKRVFYEGTKEEWENILIGEKENSCLTGKSKYYSPNLTDNKLVYSLENEEVTITDYLGIDTSITIPTEIDGKKAISIGEYAFRSCSSIKEITLSEGLTSIGNSAFINCSSLTKIILPEGLTSIGNSAFSECSNLTEINLPEGLTTIEWGAFSECSSLTEITLPEGLTTIEGYTFSDCSSLTEITLPEGLTSIGNSAFRNCSSLTEITLPEGLTSIGNNTFTGCSSLTEINLPEGLTTIEGYTFSDCSSLTEITLPEGLTTIEGGAFRGCNNLIEIILPEGLTTIEGYTFSDCSSLTEITLPEGLTSVGDSTFYGCSSLREITLPEGLTTIGDETFRGCSSIKEVTLPEELTSIGDSTFFACSSLTEISIPRGMTNVKYGTFGDCSSLTKVTIPKSIINIRGGAFYGCGERIDVYYEGTREEWNQIKQPDPLDDFAELSGLKYGSSYYDSDNDIEVSYGEGYYVYIHCNSVISGDNRQDAFINVDNNSLSYTKTYGDAAFQLQGISKIGDGTLVYTVTSGKDVVEVSPSGMVTIKNIGEAAITISMDATEHYRKAKSKIIWITVNKEAVQIISDYQYSVESNGEITITGYTGKETSILVPAEIDGKKVTAIGESAFYGCDFLQSVILPEGITSIKGSAFGDCEFLRSVILPKGITNIGSYAFSYSGLRNIVLPEGITNIGSGAFSSTGLKSIILPEGITYIRAETFNECFSLTSITIPKSVTKIGGNAFSYDREFVDINQVDIYYPGSETEWKQISKNGEWLSVAGEEYNEWSIEFIYHYNYGSSENDTRLDAVITIASDKQSYTKTCADEAFQLEGITKTGDGTLVYSVTSGNDVVEVSQTGMVTIKNAGTAVITVSMAATDTYKEAESKTITIIVSEEKEENPGTEESSSTEESSGSQESSSTEESSGNEESSSTEESSGNEESSSTEESSGNEESSSTEETSNIFSVSKIAPQSYTGKAVKPDVKVTHNGRRLVLNQDYTLAYKNNTKAGTASVTVKGKGNYAESQTVTFAIEKKDLNSSGIIIDDLALAYNGKVQKKAPTVTYHGKKLKAGTDYTVAYDDGSFKDKGTYTVSISGRGNFKGEASGKVVILDKSMIINNAKVLLSQKKYDYTGNAVKPSVTVNLKGTVLTEGEDYTVSYADNIQPGKAAIIIKGTGNYAGTKKAAFTINKQVVKLTENMISLPSSVAYEKGGCTPEPVITADGNILIKGADYTVSYKNNKKAGTASLVVKGKGIYKGTVTKRFMIAPKEISKTSMRAPDIVYTARTKAGKYISRPILTDTNGNVLGSSDYMNVVYECGNQILDKHSRPEEGSVIKVTVTGKGNYTGTASAEYMLKDASAMIKTKVSVSSKTYTGGEVTLKPGDLKVIMHRRNLVYGKDYEIVASSYKNNHKKGTAQVTLRGKGDFAGEKTIKFQITARKINVE